MSFTITIKGPNNEKDKISLDLLEFNDITQHLLGRYVDLRDKTSKAYAEMLFEMFKDFLVDYKYELDVYGDWLDE